MREGWRGGEEIGMEMEMGVEMGVEGEIVVIDWMSIVIRMSSMEIWNLFGGVKFSNKPILI